MRFIGEFEDGITPNFTSPCKVNSVWMEFIIQNDLCINCRHRKTLLCHSHICDMTKLNTHTHTHICFSYLWKNLFYISNRNTHVDLLCTIFWGQCFQFQKLQWESCELFRSELPEDLKASLWSFVVSKEKLFMFTITHQNSRCVSSSADEHV